MFDGQRSASSLQPESVMSSVKGMDGHTVLVADCVSAGQVEAQLADVQPLIDAARAAVGGIKTDHINEVRQGFSTLLTRNNAFCLI